MEVRKLINGAWIRCPVCGSKTRDRLREDTVLKNYPLYCPKCKQESLIEAKNFHITVIKEPDALDAEPMNL
ncbi:cysteine-rich KTR domain-containing protein [Clostridioides difficile]|nr:cysteine-rich KTR domain-containing protein [Clostridioides difficile]